ncbi:MULTISPECIES: curli production assembly/transport protein CsgE [unclassified Modicisalibacter]|uniref:curli production assembly/transport protein CsgE n=1 Tax=unclassified Modicisalibacter TaxID=2679913 RepID=UPI001CCB99DC|nr:curli production assembly protein CsgE [Modicisalibacter sp. R2A 31.J]MBZ9575427.1 curli production assembly protein CsgE [Modicisalibacter sp. MOD 31.J]
MTVVKARLVGSVLCALAMALSGHAPAQDEAVAGESAHVTPAQPDAPEGEDGPATQTLKPTGPLPLNGLIVDRTITMIGKTFYQQFSQRRLDSVILSNTNLVINERPSARWGSIVWVAEGNSILYQATLTPRLSDVDQYAAAAVGQVEQLILRRKVMQALEQNGDLADDEW